MKQRLLTLLLALVLAVSLAVPAAAVQTQPVEAASALELAQAMAAPVSPRGLLRARAAVTEPTRVVAFTPALATGCCIWRRGRNMCSNFRTRRRRSARSRVYRPTPM